MRFRSLAAASVEFHRDERARCEKALYRFCSMAAVSVHPRRLEYVAESKIVAGKIAAKLCK
jgi:hypothetical protein